MYTCAQKHILIFSHEMLKRILYKINNASIEKRYRPVKFAFQSSSEQFPSKNHNFYYNGLYIRTVLYCKFCISSEGL